MSEGGREGGRDVLIDSHDHAPSPLLISLSCEVT